MTWSIHSIPSQLGKIAFVTGANSGLGLDTAHALLKKGATVILGCRNIEKAETYLNRRISQSYDDRYR